MDKEALLNIGRPQKLCINCNGKIDAIDRHPSALRAAGRARFERLDYCPECWDHIKDEIYESFWITRREMKERKAPKLTRRQRSVALRALFETLWDRRDNEEVGAQLYMLSHLLMKWGGLRWRESRVDEAGREVILFEDVVTTELIEIPAVEMDDEMIALITGEIEEFLRQYSSTELVEL